MIFSIFWFILLPQIPDFLIVVSQAKYCPIITTPYINAYLFSFQVMYKPQFHKMYTYDWFCDPGDTYIVPGVTKGRVLHRLNIGLKSLSTGSRAEWSVISASFIHEYKCIIVWVSDQTQTVIRSHRCLMLSSRETDKDMISKRSFPLLLN